MDEDPWWLATERGGKGLVNWFWGMERVEAEGGVNPTTSFESLGENVSVQVAGQFLIINWAFWLGAARSRERFIS